MRRTTALKRRTPLKRGSKPLQRRTRLRERKGRRLIPLQTREALVRRARNRCERCGRQAHPMDAHHKRLRSAGGSDDLDNLALLCRRDHRWAHDNPQAACEEGWIIQVKRARGGF